MTFRRRFKLSEHQRNEMWSRWKAGQSLHEIGRVFGKDHVSIQFMLAQHGGIAPAVRRRSPLTLTLAERENISRGIACGSSIREIAKGLQRAVSTVSREVARHGGRPLYRATDADQQAWESALRPKRCLLALHVKLQEIVAGKLILDWSPEQISGWLKTEYPDDESMRVSHETIYRSLFIQARGVLKKELIQHLRFKRRIRRSRHARDSGHHKGQIVDAISIRERPAEIEDRAIPGHWEGDLIGGTKNSHIATLVEQHSRFVMLVKVSSKDTATVVAALSQHVGKLPASLRRSLTWVAGWKWPRQKLHDGHGSESLLLRSAEPLAARLERKHKRPVASVLPQTNRLSAYSQEELDEVALRLNQRPRKTLGFQTPADRLQVDS